MRKPLAATPTLSTRGEVIGRPRKQAPVDAARRVEQLAAEGRPMSGIAAMLSTTREMLRRWMDADAGLQDAFDAGRERERHELHSLMLRDARDGERPNINAMFLLKCRHGYREGDTTQEAGRVNVVITLPAARPMSDFLIEAEVENADGGNANGSERHRLSTTRT